MIDVIVKFKFNEEKTRCKAYFIYEDKEYSSSCSSSNKIHCVSYERCSFDRLTIMINNVYPNRFNLKIK